MLAPETARNAGHLASHRGQDGCAASTIVLARFREKQTHGLPDLGPCVLFFYRRPQQTIDRCSSEAIASQEADRGNVEIYRISIFRRFPNASPTRKTKRPRGRVRSWGRLFLGCSQVSGLPGWAGPEGYCAPFRPVGPPTDSPMQEALQDSQPHCQSTPPGQSCHKLAALVAPVGVEPTTSRL